MVLADDLIASYVAIVLDTVLSFLDLKSHRSGVFWYGCIAELQRGRAAALSRRCRLGGVAGEMRRDGGAAIPAPSCRSISTVCG